jgi:putative membrane protein
MTTLIMRWTINAVALYAAIAIVPGLSTGNPDWQAYIWMALIFGLINALVRPILKFLTCPLILLTLGLFTLVINTGMLYLTSSIGSNFNLDLSIDSFWAAFLGALVISVISTVLSIFIREPKRQIKRKTEK